MKRLILALILVTVLTMTVATPALAGEPPDKKPMPDKSIQGLLTACVAKGMNQTSLLKPNPAFWFPFSVKAWIDFEHLGPGTPVALGWWK